MRIVVTGGAGFIGANLCAALADEGHEVLALDDLSTGSAANLDGQPVKLVEGSVLDRPLVHDVLTGTDAVIHLAARGSVPRSLAHPLPTHEVNATGTAVVLDAARATGVAHFVLSSSSSVYGANPALPKHEDLVPSPVSPYAASKLGAEVTALAFQRSFGLPVLALRFFNVFGPLQPADHDYAAVVPRFIAAALAGRPAEVHGDGGQTRDFTYVGTVVRVLSDAVSGAVTADGPVNLAFGSRVSLLEVLAELEDLLGHPVERRHVDARRGDIRHSQADGTRLHQLFPGIQAVPLREGLARTVRWFRQP